MRKKIEFLDRLFKLLKCRTDILQFLKDEHLINDDTMQNLLHNPHQTHSTSIAGLLDELQKTEKLQLVNYEWSVLPNEFLQLTIVADNGKREFTYSV